MVPPGQRKETSSQVAALEERIRESPQLVVEYVRLARLLEEAGDARGAASVLQRAHFFLPNGPNIVSDLRRLSEWISSEPAPVTIALPPTLPQADSDSAVDVEEKTSEPEARQEDDLDELIEGLEKGRLGSRSEAVTSQEVEWLDDDGLVATETLAHIYVAQKQFQEAVLVYDRLAEKESDPEKAATLRERASELREKLTDSS